MISLNLVLFISLAHLFLLNDCKDLDNNNVENEDALQQKLERILLKLEIGTN